MNTITKCYSDLIEIDSFIERFRYVKEHNRVGEDTFGFDRWLNQVFYKSPEWRAVRNKVIVRDNGCDLAWPTREIAGPVYVHHLIPLTAKDIEKRSEFLLDPEYLVCVSRDTHNAIHYGDESMLMPESFAERRPGDTKLW